MIDDKEDAATEQDQKQESAEVELTEAELTDISAGINPQPLPPGRSK